MLLFQQELQGARYEEFFYRYQLNLQFSEKLIAWLWTSGWWEIVLSLLLQFSGGWQQLLFVMILIRCCTLQVLPRDFFHIIFFPYLSRSCPAQPDATLVIDIHYSTLNWVWFTSWRSMTVHWPIQHWFRRTITASHQETRVKTFCLLSTAPGVRGWPFLGCYIARDIKN